MASKLPGTDAVPNDSDGETPSLHFKKKRARRVSFADTEITSVHIFRRDDDNETPPESKSGPPDSAAAENEVLGFFGDLVGESEDSGDEDGDSIGVRKSFLRPLGSPSPGGSSTADSAASNDDDDFFGPVSSSFIRPGRFSDSGISDDIHEETMDTTAFSLHYRSLARSESEEAKTPTAVRLNFEDKTESKDTNPTGSGSLMALTEPKKLISQPLVPIASVQSGEDSDDMSIVNKNPKSYDFGVISPTISTLLTERNSDLDANIVAVTVGSMSPVVNEVLTNDQNGTSHIDERKGCDFDAPEKSTDEAFAPNTVRQPNVGSVDLNFSGNLSGRNTNLTPSASEYKLGRPDQLISGSKRLVEETTPRNILSSLEFPSLHRDTQQNMDIVSLETDVGPRQESVGQHLSKTPVREYSPKKRTYVPNNSNHFDPQVVSSPFTLLSSAGPESFFNTPNSARGQDTGLSSLKHANPQINDLVKHSERMSEFKVHDHSYPGSAVKQGIETLKRRLSKYSSVSSPAGGVLSGKSRELKSKYASSPGAGPEDQVSNADPKNDEDRNLVRMDVNQEKTPRSTTKLGQKEATVLVKDRDSQQSMSIDAISNEKRDKSMTPFCSALKLLSPGTKLMWDTLISEDSTKNMILMSETDSELINGKLQFESRTFRYTPTDMEKRNVNTDSGSSKRNLQTVKNIQLSSSTILQSPYNKDWTQGLFGKVQTQDHQGETPSQKVAPGKEIMDSSYRVNPTQSFTKLTRSPLIKEPNSKSPRKVTVQISPNKDRARNSARKEPLQGSLVKELTWTSPSAKADENSFMKEQIKSPSRLSQSNAIHGSNRLQLIKDIAFHHYASKSVQVSDSPLIKDTGSVDVRKRGNTEVFLGDGDRTNKIPKIRRSPHFLKRYDSELTPDQIVQTSNEEDKVDSSQTQKHWLETFQKISWDAGHLLSSSIDVLTLESITSLEDILDYFLKVKNYEILHSEIQSQEAADQLSLQRSKRLAETRLLLCKIAHEKAKLKLMAGKHDKLLKNTQLLKSGLQECQMLKSSYVQQPKIYRSDAQLDDHQQQSSSANLESEHLVPSDTMDSMKQEVEALDRKIKSLSNFFQKQCKMTGDISYDVTLTSIQDHLMKRKCSRLIRQDLQLWKVDGFERQSGQYNIILSYRGYLSQRFTLTSAPISSFIISNQLNDKSILKNFPNMNALVAFTFVYNAEVSKRGVESKCLAQATQVTHSLLCNLLDVIEEVQMAQLEIGNLVQTNFHCLPGQHQLNLQLNFINYHSGVKVTLILDVTCLSSGTYPSDIIPCDIHIPLVTTQNLTSLSCKVRSGAETLQVGHSRIVRLCRCVSQLLLQDSSSTM